MNKKTRLAVVNSNAEIIRYCMDICDAVQEYSQRTGKDVGLAGDYYVFTMNYTTTIFKYKPWYRLGRCFSFYVDKDFSFRHIERFKERFICELPCIAEAIVAKVKRLRAKTAVYIESVDALIGLPQEDVHGDSHIVSAPSVSEVAAGDSTEEQSRFDNIDLSESTHNE